MALKILAKLKSKNYKVDTKYWNTKCAVITRNFGDTIEEIYKEILQKPMKDFIGSFTKQDDLLVFTTEINPKNDLEIYFDSKGNFVNFEIEIVECDLQGLF